MKSTTAPTDVTAVRRPIVVRAGLVALGVVQLAIGLWAIVDARGWFDAFPGAGHSWLPAYGAYNEHLALDVGATFVALGALLLLAAWWLERRIVQAALVAYLLYAAPHLVYHLGADDALPAGDQIASGITLALSVIAPAVLLVLTGRRAPASRSRLGFAGTDGAARIPPRERGLLARMSGWYARRSYGEEITPGGVFAHHPKLAIGYGGFELATERSHLVDDRLKALAEIKAAAMVNCEWCIDFGSFIAHRRGISEEQLREMPRHGESAAFDPLEKLILDYAVAMSRTPAEVDDELFARLREHFDDAQLVELTSAIAIENFRARFNHATGMTAQGFSEGMVCVVPEPEAAFGSGPRETATGGR